MPKLDDIDKEILRYLRANGREKANAIADRLKTTAGVTISGGAVRRRVARLEEEDVIAGYTVVVNHEKVDRSIEAYVELTFEGKADVQRILRGALEDPEVREASTLAGEPDAVVRVRADDVGGLRDVVTRLRELESVTGSKTLVALGRLRHVAKYPQA